MFFFLKSSDFSELCSDLLVTDLPSAGASRRTNTDTGGKGRIMQTLIVQESRKDFKNTIFNQHIMLVLLGLKKTINSC